MTDADAIAYELATASAERRHAIAAELAALRDLASCANSNRRRLPSAVAHLLAKVPGSPKRCAPPPEPELQSGESLPLV